MGKKSAQKSDDALKQMANIAQKQFDVSSGLIQESAPARKLAMNTYMGLSRGNLPGIEKFTAPQTQVIDRTYAQAEAAVQQMPPGGQRDQAMREIQLQKAAAKNQAYTGNIQGSLAQVANMGYGGTQMGMGGYGSAADMYTNEAKMYADMSGAKGGMAGQGAGIAGSLGAAAIMA